MKSVLTLAVATCLLASCAISESGNSRRVTGVPFLTGFAPASHKVDNRKVEQLLEASPRVVSTEYIPGETFCIVQVENPGVKPVYYFAHDESFPVSDLELWREGKWQPDDQANHCMSGMAQMAIPAGESRYLSCHLGLDDTRRRVVVRFIEPKASQVWDLPVASYPY